MTQASPVYAAARMAARENRFLDAETFRRLEHAADEPECEKLLAEAGWGNFETASAENPSAGEARIEAERRELFRFMRETGTASALSDVFEGNEDFFNCKCAVKFRMTGNSAFANLASPLGRMPAERVFGAVSGELFRELPGEMAEALSDLKSIWERETPSPRTIDARLDRACFGARERLASRLPKTVRRVFCLEADLVNLTTMLRLRGLGLRADGNSFVPGGFEPVDFWGKLDGKKSEEMRAELRGRECFPLVDALLSEEADPFGIDRIRRTFASSLLSEERAGAGLEAKFWFRKLAEIGRVRRILVCRRNGLNI